MDTSPSRARTALPPAREPRADEVRRDPVEGFRALLQELGELGDELEEIVEREEAPVQRLSGANEWLRRIHVHVHIVFALAQDDALPDGLLARIRIGVEVPDRRVGDPVEEAEAGGSSELSGGIG